jgi:hypothetical protein
MRRFFLLAWAFWLDALLSEAALAQSERSIESVTVLGRRADLTGIAASANQGSISAADMSLRPLLRPAEIVENIPGVEDFHLHPSEPREFRLSLTAHF